MAEISHQSNHPATFVDLRNGEFYDTEEVFKQPTIFKNSKDHIIPANVRVNNIDALVQKHRKSEFFRK